MSCSNCFNGCAETVSDQCIRYTGVDVPELGILHGDSLLSVENAIVNFLVPTLNGTGIKPIIDTNIICDVVKKYLPTCTICAGFTLNEVLTAIIKSVCDLQDQIDLIVADIAELNADYTLGCVTGVTSSAGTHNVLQATINKLCAINTTLIALTAQLNNYALIVDLPSYIATYLSTSGLTTKYYNRMIPYAVVEYYGLTSGPGTPNFDGTGAGTGDWEKIYLCNGENSTPDKRGVIGVGATNGSMLGLTMPSRTNPGTPGNPVYIVNAPYGNNTTTLGIAEIPNHTHVATVTVVDPKHDHIEGFAGINSGASYGVSPPIAVAGNINTQSGTSTSNHAVTSKSATGLATPGAITVVNTAWGGSGAHTNIQPVLPCLYIQYRP
jgi:hypothetical protein